MAQVLQLAGEYEDAGEAAGRVVFPVAGGRGAASFTDDFRSPRGRGGHCPDQPTWHCATDVFAAHGTPVLAPIGGRLTRVGYQAVGGNRLWVESGSERFYLAHLSAYSPGVAEGVTVEAGTVVGFVGATGSAVGTPPHLHIAWEHLGQEGVWRVQNPYPLMIQAAGP